MVDLIFNNNINNNIYLFQVQYPNLRFLFTYTRLPYEASVAPSIFQRVIDSLFQGMPNVLICLDDILANRQTEEDHIHTLEQVLLKLNTYGFHLKKEKCAFLKSEVV